MNRQSNKLLLRRSFISTQVQKKQVELVNPLNVHQETAHSPPITDDRTVQVVSSTKLTDRLDWSIHTSSLARRVFALPASDEESTAVSFHPDHFLQRTHRERADQLHLHLAW